MRGSEPGNATPEKRKARAVLTVRDPSIESLLAGLDFDGVDIAALRAFSKQCWSSRNTWDVRRRRSGLFGSVRLRREDGDRALNAALRELAEAGRRHRQMIEAWARYGANGATPEQIALDVDLPVHVVRPRAGELVRLGKFFEVGKRPGGMGHLVTAYSTIDPDALGEAA